MSEKVKEMKEMREIISKDSSDHQETENESSSFQINKEFDSINNNFKKVNIIEKEYTFYNIPFDLNLRYITVMLLLILIIGILFMCLIIKYNYKKIIIKELSQVIDQKEAETEKNITFINITNSNTTSSKNITESENETNQNKKEERFTSYPTLLEMSQELIPEKYPIFHANKITNKIYLGSMIGAKDLNYLRNESIFHVLSVTGQVKHEDDEKYGIQRKFLNFPDLTSTNIIQYFPECIKYIEESEGPVFVHCEKGMSRSSTIVIAYLMWKTHSSFLETFYYVRSKRYIKPNKGFVEQLKIYEELLLKNSYKLDSEDFQQLNNITVLNFFSNLNKNFK